LCREDQLLFEIFLAGVPPVETDLGESRHSLRSIGWSNVLQLQVIRMNQREDLADHNRLPRLAIRAYSGRFLRILGFLTS
jgi:hypothetical protein